MVHVTLNSSLLGQTCIRTSKINDDPLPNSQCTIPKAAVPDTMTNNYSEEFKRINDVCLNYNCSIGPCILDFCYDHESPKGGYYACIQRYLRMEYRENRPMAMSPRTKDILFSFIHRCENMNKTRIDCVGEFVKVCLSARMSNRSNKILRCLREPFAICRNKMQLRRLRCRRKLRTNIANTLDQLCADHKYRRKCVSFNCMHACILQNCHAYYV